ncbi:MAG: hypothetical protein R3E62_07550 [Pseudomonadales bacterium]|jgi:hypothetical protein
MKLYILLDDESPEEVADKLVQAMTKWFVDAELAGEIVDVREGDVEDWTVGLNLEIGRKAGLRKPLEFLYKQAKKMEREFVIGLYGKTGNREDICYFGFEEGRPDVDEVALYLGLNR